MPTTTQNYSLVKPALTDSPPDITAMNPNWDKIDTEMKKNADSAKVAQTMETAGGTATVVTIANFTLENGISRKFVASASNAGAATTLNGKPIYKPNTVIAPNIVAGKAYEVWYSSAGDCFFLVASAEGNAVAANVLAGKTFSNDNDAGIAGTMPNRGAIAHSLPINGTFAIEEGYHNGAGSVTQSIPTKQAAIITPGTSNQSIAAGQYLVGAQTIEGDADLISANIKSGVTIFGVAGNANVVDTSDADADVQHILSGKIAYTDGTKKIGTMPNNGTIYYTPSTVNQAIPAGYHSGGGIVYGDADLISANIKSGVNIFGVQGNSNVVDTSPGTAAAGDIFTGKIAFVDGVQLTGTMPNQGPASLDTVSLTTQGSLYTVPAGYHSGLRKVQANFANLSAGNIKAGVNVGGIVGSLGSIKSAQYKCYDYDSGADGNIANPTINAVDVNSSLMLFYGDHNYMRLPTFTSTSITFTAKAGSAQIIEFDNVKSKQTGYISVPANAVSVVNISEVNWAKCMLVLNTGCYTSGKGFNTLYPLLFTPTSFSLSAQTAYDAWADWQLIEFY